MFPGCHKSFVMFSDGSFNSLPKALPPWCRCGILPPSFRLAWICILYLCSEHWTQIAVNERNRIDRVLSSKQRVQNSLYHTSNAFISNPTALDTYLLCCAFDDGIYFCLGCWLYRHTLGIILRGGIGWYHRCFGRYFALFNNVALGLVITTYTPLEAMFNDTVIKWFVRLLVRGNLLVVMWKFANFKLRGVNSLGGEFHTDLLAYGHSHLTFE